jgi:hypothetical protein
MDSARKHPGTAFLLSVIPGAGHVYAGRIGRGLFWLVILFVAYEKYAGLGFVLHFFCAVSAGLAASQANREEKRNMESRRQSAEDVAAMLDRASRNAPAPPVPPAAAPAPAADPPPRLMRAAFPATPDRLVGALAEGMARSGLLVLGVDREHLRIRASIDLGGGKFSMLAAQVEATPAGSRVRLMIDRPEGSSGGADVDDSVLRGVLEETERSLGRDAGGAAGAASIQGSGEALTEDHFLEQLREAWEAFDQGWLPEQEWLERKRSLVRSVSLRPGTRPGDVMTACRPLVEAGVLEPEDLRALEATLGGAR